jgi:hypothetical protein
MRSLMISPVVSALLAFISSMLRSRASLYLEHLAPRHQLAVYQHTIHRPRLRPTDRLFWAWLSRLWSGWQSALAFVQPHTVIAWQRQRFRDHMTGQVSTSVVKFSHKFQFSGHTGAHAELGMSTTLPATLIERDIQTLRVQKME